MRDVSDKVMEATAKNLIVGSFSIDSFQLWNLISMKEHTQAHKITEVTLMTIPTEEVQSQTQLELVAML